MFEKFINEFNLRNENLFIIGDINNKIGFQSEPTDIDFHQTKVIYINLNCFTSIFKTPNNVF